MPTLDEMLAQGTQFGTIGGVRTAEQDIRTQEEHEVQQKRRKLDVRAKTAELEDYLAERPTRRAKAKVEKQRAEREIDLQEDLDEKARVAIENDISSLVRQMDVRQQEGLAQMLANVEDQETYDMVYSQLDPEMRQEWGLGEDYNKNKRRIRVAYESALRTMEHQRARDLLYAKTVSDFQASQQSLKNYAPYASTDLGDSTDAVAVIQQMSQDPFFSSLGTDKDDPALVATAREIEMAAKEEIVRSNNLARDLNDNSYVVGPRTAMAKAINRQKVLMHKYENPWFGAPRLRSMTPEEFAELRTTWFTEYEAIAARQVPGWDRLSEAERLRVLENAFYYERKAQFDQQTARVNMGK